jgi:hypothetical protein
VDCGLILHKYMGSVANMAGISWLWIYFRMEKYMDSVHRMVDRVGAWSTVDPWTQA